MRMNRLFPETRRQWPAMTAYERFEQSVAICLSVIVALVVLVALIRLTGVVYRLLLSGAFNPIEHQAFQVVFGGIMTLLIALEFNHSILKLGARQGSIIQVRTVILIALLAMSRKFIILDITETDAWIVAAMALATLTLGAVYWLVRDRDGRLASSSAAATPLENTGQRAHVNPQAEAKS